MLFRSIPTAVNQVWQDFSREGLVWGVTADLLPLETGESITLTVGDAYYWEEHSRFSGTLTEGMPVYVQVDSANAQTTYGGVLETHEIFGEAYNNISSAISTLGELEIDGAVRRLRGDDAGRGLPLRPGSLWRQ